MASLRSLVFSLILFMVAHASAASGRKIVLGFSQIGAESAWRVANTKSIKDAAAAAGIDLVFSDAQQNQANQIKAVKSFILQKVDAIVIAPVVVTGWHDVLMKAKKAKIPVILLDREIDAADSNLYVSFIGADFREEGRRAGRCMIDALKGRHGDSFNIVELRGTEGSAPAIERQAGFAEVLKAAGPQYKIVRSESGDFKESDAKVLMEKILREGVGANKKIDAVFAHNDNMALGAIPAIEAHGLKPGKDVVIVSVDAIRDAFLAMKSGKLNCTVECSPLLGPQLMKVVQQLVDGKSIPPRIVTEEGVFPASTAERELPNRKY